ncbi:NnrS family protein [Piscinibacter sp.]|uniref:NnrS family protein n=1 Tax=Piscinibacter sp. TaxID=1903157 RepID=UPI0039E6A0F3
MKPGHPLWQCGLRPFFTAAAWVALLSIGTWAAALALALPITPAWHAQAMLEHMGLAAVAGFLLTAVPEFTATPQVPPRTTRRLFGAWALGLAGSLAPGALGHALALAGALTLIGGLLATVWPRLRADPQRAHRSFAAALLALGAGVAAHHLAALLGRPAASFLHALLGIYMALLVLAMSRISMRIVNAALDDERARAGRDGRRATAAVYLARPPHRQLALALIAAHTLAQMAWPGHRAAGWLALAAAAAVLQLMGDWHVGRALLRRRPLMLYAVYAAMAAGYALWGVAVLADAPAWASAARHVLGIGAFGLAILTVFVIAGRAHCGLWPDERPWVPAAALALLGAAAARALSALGIGDAPTGLLLAAALWMLAFGAVLMRLAPAWRRERADGRRGCQGPDHTVEGC